jgi:L-asparaginase II
MITGQVAGQPTSQPTTHLSVEPLVEVTRGGRLEAIHFGAIVVVDSHGCLVAHLGDPDGVTYLRSTAKPFQLLPLVESGAADRFGFTDRELATMAASHSGEPRHVETVRGILDKIGLGEDALLCGAHWPLSEETTRALRASGREPTPIHNNCSGKHAGMLAQCAARGSSTHDYLDPQHPIQQTILHTLAGLCDLDPAAIGVGVDGCSAPCFALPLRACALAFARLADPSALHESRRSAVTRIVQAMTAYPEMVAGIDRLDTDLMRAANGRVVSKGGAEGYHGVGVLGRGWGLTAKIVDGNGARASGPVVVEALRQLGVLDEAAVTSLRAHHAPIARNYRGLEVGEVKPVFKLAP